MGLTRGRPAVSQEMAGRPECARDSLLPPGGGGGAGASPAELSLPARTAVRLVRARVSPPPQDLGPHAQAALRGVPQRNLRKIRSTGGPQGSTVPRSPVKPSGALAGVSSSNRGKTWSDAGPVASDGQDRGTDQKFSLGISSREISLGGQGSSEFLAQQSPLLGGLAECCAPGLGEVPAPAGPAIPPRTVEGACQKSLGPPAREIILGGKTLS